VWGSLTWRAHWSNMACILVRAARSTRVVVVLLQTVTKAALLDDSRHRGRAVALSRATRRAAMAAGDMRLRGVGCGGRAGV
jgi:hypothetical protein